jgi:hypothetical protein
MNPFPYSMDNKRYHTLYYHNRQVFGGRVYKAVLDGGFTCPNIDGTKGVGGCAFCDGGSGAFTHPAPLPEQLALELARIRCRDENARAIAYFQVHTNTYAPVEHLRELYETAVAYPEICGLSVGTRPDCLPEDVLALLSDLNRRTCLTVELGVQTIHERTAAAFGRGYTFSDFLTSYERLQALGIRTCLHLIDGLPEESTEDMLQTAQVLGKLCPQAVKIQLLHVLEGTRYAQLYRSGGIQPMTREAYIDIVVRQLELLPPETVVERVTGDGEKAKLLAPAWSMDKIRTLAGIDKEQVRRNSWQGKKYAESNN